jgi:hypothetical protein
LYSAGPCQRDGSPLAVSYLDGSPNEGLLKKPDQLQRNLFQRSKPDKLAQGNRRLLQLLSTADVPETP